MKQRIVNKGDHSTVATTVSMSSLWLRRPLFQITSGHNVQYQPAPDTIPTSNPRQAPTSYRPEQLLPVCRRQCSKFWTKLRFSTWRSLPARVSQRVWLGVPLGWSPLLPSRHFSVSPLTQLATASSVLQQTTSSSSN